MLVKRSIRAWATAVTLLSILFLSTAAAECRYQGPAIALGQGGVMVVTSNTLNYTSGFWSGEQIPFSYPSTSVVHNNYKYSIGAFQSQSKQMDVTTSLYSICREPAASFSKIVYETTTNACPASQPSGVINMRRSYELWSDGSKRNYSGWSETSRTCAAIKTGNSSETQSRSCPATHPAGTWTQRRTFETWSDGVNRNHGAWTDVTKTCAATKVRNATETQILACPPLTPSGTWQQSRPYEVWTDGNRNFGSWSNVSVCYNQTPSVSNRTLAHDEDTTGTLTLTAVDDHSQITYELMGQPANGSASVSGTQLRFTPRANWNGTTSLTYRAIDPAGAISNTATVTITVRPVNDKPIVQDVTRSIPEDTSVTIALELEDVDLQFEGDTHAFEILDDLDEEVGIYTLTERSLEVVPAQDWNGTISLRYLARDSHGLASDVKVIAVKVTYVNDAPTETGASILAREGMTSDHVEPWVVDADLPYGDEHTFEIVTQPANGSAQFIYGKLEYTPNPQFFGNDSFIIRATDKDGAFVDGEVRVVVAKFNYAPTDIVPGVVTLYAGIGGTAEIQVVDPNTWGSHVLEVVGQPAHGTASINGNVLTLRTDDDTETTVRLKATDQDGLVFEKNIVVKFDSAWGMFEGRDVVPSGAQVSVPAVKQFMTRRNGTHALLLEDTAVLSALGSDIVALVTPDSPVGVTLEHRELAPEIGMRLTPTRLTSAVLEARVAGLDVGVDGTAQLYLSRADMQGPVYSVPVKSWAPQGSLQSTAWEIRQGVDKTAIRFESSGNACVISTSESQVKPKNVLQEPTCLIEWTAYPEEWRNSGNSTLLSIEAMGKTAGLHPVKASAFVFDPQGGKHWIADFDHNLTVTSAADIFSFGLQPAPAQTYQSVQNLALVMRQSGGTACDMTTTQTIAQNVAKQWPSKPMCFIRWTSMPEGMAQSSSWHVPQAVGAPTVLGAQSISWKASVFTPAGDEIDLSMGSHDLEVIEPPAIEIELPTTNRVGEGIYSVSQLGGYVGNVTLSTLAADIDLSVSRDNNEIESRMIPSYGRTQRISRFVEGDERPLWSETPYRFTARYTKLPTLETSKEMTLLAVPHEKILPVIMNDERRVLDTASLPVNVQILDTRYPEDGYNLSKMGDWDVRLLMSTAGVTYEPISDWEPISEEGLASFEMDLALLTNKMVRVVAEARVRSPVPGYESIRKSSFPMTLTVLNGEPLDGMIQALRVIGPAPLRSTFYAMTVNRFETSDLGDVRWEMSKDGGATWETVENTGQLSQRLTMVFAKGTYLLRAEMTNRHSGEKSFTPNIEVIAYEVPVARLKGPANVFITDTGRFVLTDMAGNDLDTTGMVVEWSEDRGKTWVEGTGTYEVTRDAAERVYLMARVKFADSPDDKRVYRNLRAGVAFRAVRPPRVQLIGPRRPEVGKEGIWKANMMMPYPKMDLTMDGYFILPNGEEVHEREVAYTPTMDDFTEEKSYIGFEAWINGYEDKGGKGLTQHRLLFWSYDWPEWSIQAKTSAVYSPADLTMQTRSLGLFREFEGLTMDWDIPPYSGMEIVKDTAQNSRILRITEAGTYTFGVHVSDARGNYSYAETELTFMEPIPYDVTLSWSGDNPALRAPLGVLIRPTITGGHPKDRIETRAFSLNGEPLANSGDYGRAVLDKGEHTVRLDIASQMGHTAYGEVAIQVEENTAPVCTIEVTEGRTSWLARSGCTDEDGRVVRHLWFIDGVQQAITSSSISVPMWRYPNGEPVITLVGIDDSGAESDPVANY